MAAPERLSTVDAALTWLQFRGVRSLCTDSRRVGPGDAFVAWPGHAVDGRRFVPAALAAGAAAALVEDDGAASFEFDDERVARVVGLKALTGELASRMLSVPSGRMRLIACTGTNGKTSITWWTAQALAAIGEPCGVVGTLGIGEPPLGDRPSSVVPTGLTTPDPVVLQTALARFVEAGVRSCAIEASSIGIAEHRLAGCRVEVAVFSNFTQDHLDYHGSMEGYWQAKAQLFRWPGLREAVLNFDDVRGRLLADELDARRVGFTGTGWNDGAPPYIWTYSAVGPARLAARNIAYRDGGLCFDVVEQGQAVPVCTRLIGGYNVSNLLAVLATLRALGLPLAEAAAACSRLTPVPGRMQQLPAASGEPAVVVDYAHTPDALEKALVGLQPYVQERGGRLCCVFGCGGNRDAGKRPAMGAIAARLAQRVVVTSDNPRQEAPAAIIGQILAGIGGAAGGEVLAIEDRAAAIDAAIGAAAAADVVLIAGKGHEDHQEIAGRKLPFSDAEVALAALRRRTGVAA